MINENICGHLCVFSKSSMSDIEPDYCGRPFGGMAMVCKKRHGLMYEEIDIKSDRIMGVKICNDSGILQIVLSVYMPFYSGDVKQSYI